MRCNAANELMGQQEPSRLPSRAREIAVTFNRERPMGRAEVPSIDGSVSAHGGRAFRKSIDIDLWSPSSLEGTP